MESAPLILAALDRCRGLEANVKDGLRLRLNMAAGQLGEAARNALELARREQVGRGRPITLGGFFLGGTTVNQCGADGRRIRTCEIGVSADGM